jgi:hypothetical protein
MSQRAAELGREGLIPMKNPPPFPGVFGGIIFDKKT